RRTSVVRLRRRGPRPGVGGAVDEERTEVRAGSRFGPAEGSEIGNKGRQRIESDREQGGSRGRGQFAFGGGCTDEGCWRPPVQGLRPLSFRGAALRERFRLARPIC